MNESLNAHTTEQLTMDTLDQITFHLGGEILLVDAHSSAHEISKAFCLKIHQPKGNVRQSMNSTHCGLEAST